jgi:hypothetical protein
MKKRAITRRTVLRGLGTAVALPWLETMRPAAALAAPAADTAGPPLRMAFFFVPNGIHMQDWTPEQTGTDFDLPPTLASLAGVRDRLLVISGLAHDKARPNGDGPGDHARSASAFLTGAQPYKTDGANIKVGVSVDQVAAERVGGQTRFASLELGCEGGLNSGNCDSGYSCAYSHNISWKTESTPMSKEVDPREVFERLFTSGPEGEAAEARARRERRRKSVLDFVLDDARRLADRLGQTDRRKLDEYLVSVRELEQRIERAEAEAAERLPKLAKPDGIPREYRDHLRLMGDLLALAFQGDLTRIATFMLANEGSNRSYPFIDVPDGHHDLSHHGNDDAKQAKIAGINRFHMEQFAYFLEKLKTTPEADGTLLDHAMVVYGSAIGDGDAHNHDDLPILLAGGASGTVDTGRHVRLRRETPVNNLYLSMLDRMGVELETFGDGTGRLGELSG